MGHAEPLWNGRNVPHRRVWIDDDGRPWLVSARFAFVAGRPEIVGMEVRSVREDSDAERAQFPDFPTVEETREGRPAARITSSVWRDVERLLTAMRKDQAQVAADPHLAGDPDGRVERLWKGPRERARLELEEVADIYRRAEENGESTGAAVSEHFSVELSTARKRIQRARAAGLLPPVQPTNKTTKRKRGSDGKHQAASGHREVESSLPRTGQAGEA